MPGSEDVRLGLMLEEGCLDLNAAHSGGQVVLETATLLDDVLRGNNGLQALEKTALGRKPEFNGGIRHPHRRLPASPTGLRSPKSNRYRAQLP